MTFSVSAILNFQGLLKKLQTNNPTGIEFDTAKEQIYYPLPYSVDFFPVKGVYLSIEYEQDGKFDLFLLETESSYKDNIVVGFGMKGNKYGIYKTKRKTSPDPYTRGKLKVYAETKLDDLSATFSFYDLNLFVSKVEVIWHSTMDKVVVSHGWVGSLDYKAAKKSLKNVTCDDKNESIYFLNDYGCLKNDWDSNNVDITFGVFESKFQQGMFADARHVSHTKRKQKFYSNCKVVNEIKLAMEAELEDLPVPLLFKDIELSVLQHKDVKTVEFLKVFPLFDY